MDAKDDELTPSERPKRDGPPIVLAAFGAVCVVAGVGLLSYDVLTELSHTFGWPISFGWVLVATGTLCLLAFAIARTATDVPERSLEARLLPPPESTHRRNIAIAVGVAVIVQLLVPMSYYFGDDPYDERFAWRMFSAVRVYRCSADATEVNQGSTERIALPEEVHVAWIRTMQRNREAVIARFLRWRCEEAGADSVRFVNRCLSPEGRRAPDVVRAIDCASGEIGDE